MIETRFWHPLILLVLSACGGTTTEIASTGTGGDGGDGNTGGSGASTADGGSGGLAMDGSIACESIAGAVLLGSCRVQVVPSDPKPGPAPNFSITGPVIETGPAVASECKAAFASPEAFEFQLEGEGGQWKFVVDVPGFHNPLFEGEVINVVSSSSSVVSVGAVNPYVTVRDANGELLFHVTEARDLVGLYLPPGFDVDLGDAICSGADECGSWAHHSLVVSTDDQSSVVPFLGSSTLGGYRLTHGGCELRTPTSCQGGHVALAIVQLPLE